ncbi:uncharacterized protein MAM_01757 [Metarhizium album ARSEF 1941]|uniref:Uncharacterized protein n=1 Tax=Metarhizium album (strain ARSEF 1941) TaxID=1081103 RepID=A0A0B2X3Q3_METAS|nr:uncharacterized protein MAM_01757 [Metarhizium album ARSEF 1941]KHO00979.1 hypothetical protein MAM_01757 [Metarhizium album ARSEF 1941]
MDLLTLSLSLFLSLFSPLPLHPSPPITDGWTDGRTDGCDGPRRPAFCFSTDEPNSAATGLKRIERLGRFLRRTPTGPWRRMAWDVFIGPSAMPVAAAAAAATAAVVVVVNPESRTPEMLLSVLPSFQTTGMRSPPLCGPPSDVVSRTEPKDNRVDSTEYRRWRGL